jgi:hypothetical protein
MAVMKMFFRTLGPLGILAGVTLVLQRWNPMRIHFFAGMRHTSLWGSLCLLAGLVMIMLARGGARKS